MWRDAADGLIQKSYGAGKRWDDAGNSVKDGGFTRSVGADQGNYFALFDGSGDAFQCFDSTIVNIELIKREQRQPPFRDKLR